MKHGTLQVEMLTTGPFAVNTYLVGCTRTRDAAVIDPGGQSDTLLDMAHANDLKITKLLLTHGHIDHIAGLKEMQKATEAPIYLHEQDTTIYTTAPMQGLFFGLRVSQPPKANRSVTEGEEISIGEEVALVVHTPGHSAGSVCYYFQSAGVLFSGDLLFEGAIGRTDLPGGSNRAMSASLKRIVDLCPDETVVYPGHMGSTTISRERRNNPYLTGSWW
ncbi:MAG: MBL fold metallo-hydrolase [Bradymonadales bacterium]|nr:MBL fold metallo-hydrolase [Bradymonadales bacterium]